MVINFITELNEMSNYDNELTDIDNLMIWIGEIPKYHGYRIKVSNIPNKFDVSNCFVITIPKLEIIGEIDKSFIKTKMMKKLFSFIEQNMDLITKLIDKEILDFDFQIEVINRRLTK